MKENMKMEYGHTIRFVWLAAIIVLYQCRELSAPWLFKNLQMPFMKIYYIDS